MPSRLAAHPVDLSSIRPGTMSSDAQAASASPSMPADFQAIWDQEARTLKVVLELDGRLFRLVFTGWDEGIHWTRVRDGESESMPLALDPGLPLLDPRVGNSYAVRTTGHVQTSTRGS